MFDERLGRILEADGHAAGDLGLRATEVSPQRLSSQFGFEVPDRRLDPGLRHPVLTNRGKRVAHLRRTRDPRRLQQRHDVLRGHQPRGIDRLVVVKRVLPGDAFAVPGHPASGKHSDEENAPPGDASEARFERGLQRQLDLSELDSFELQVHDLTGQCRWVWRVHG